MWLAFLVCQRYGASRVPHSCRLWKRGEFDSNLQTFNDLRFHSNANNKVIDKQCTSMLFYRVFAATQPRTVLTSLATACTPARGSNSHCNVFRINTYKSLSKQTTLTVIESYSYKKQGGGGVLWLTSSVLASPFRHSDVSYPVSLVVACPPGRVTLTKTAGSHPSKQAFWIEALGSRSLKTMSPDACRVKSFTWRRAQ